ncbi:MAG TPA: hypothetical protein VLA56_12820 [Pseudomonadales bacterium]|nr:hypothetical protein [Pseudomonadales bacterium]
MPHVPEQLDPDAWHRYFAMATNNQAWSLAALPERSPEQREEMLDAAHASAWHWRKVGTELQAVRATMLLAEVHALCGWGTAALAEAQRVAAFFEGRAADDWELAFVHTVHAHAAAVAGDTKRHRAAWDAAIAALEAIEDPEDHAIVLKTFVQVPAP